MINKSLKKYLLKKRENVAQWQACLPLLCKALGSTLVPEKQINTRKSQHVNIRQWAPSASTHAREHPVNFLNFCKVYQNIIVFYYVFSMFSSFTLKVQNSQFGLHSEFRAILNYEVRPCLKNKTHTHHHHHQLHNLRKMILRNLLCLGNKISIQPCIIESSVQLFMQYRCYKCLVAQLQ